MSERETFEAWVKSPPYEKIVTTIAGDRMWSGQYVSYEVQLAWEAWQAGGAALAAAEARENELRRQLEETVLGATARVCDTPACRAAIIRRDDGARVCAAGHRARWVDIAELDAAEARERALAAECARLREALEGAYRQIRDIVRGHLVECCITCAHPKSRSNVGGEEVVLGWPECINPSCVAHGDRVASASYGPALTPPARDGSIGMPTSCRKAFEQANRPTGGDDA